MRNGAHLSPLTSHLSPLSSQRGFTLIEIIAVVSVIAILVAVIAPSVIRRVDQAAWTKETADLNTIADAYTQYILRNKSVRGTNDWAIAIANQMSLPVSAITTNARRLARAFLVDPDLRVNGAVLPYSQAYTGATNVASARVIIVSSLSRALPISTGIPSSTEFSAIWNTAEGAKPMTATWTTWAGTGDDLRIKKLNLEPLFYQLILVDHRSNTNPPSPWFSIDNWSATNVPPGALGLNKYYLDGTVVGLHYLDTTGAVQLQSRHLLKRNISFLFESSAWRGEVEGDQQSFSASGSDFYNHAVTFVTRPTNPWGPQAQGASQWGVIIAMYTFMFDYTYWANECPTHFDRHGNQLSSVPEYVLLHNQGQNNGNVDQFSTQLIYAR